MNRDMLDKLTQQKLTARSEARLKNMPYGQRMMEKYIINGDNARKMLPQPPTPMQSSVVMPSEADPNSTVMPSEMRRRRK